MASTTNGQHEALEMFKRTTKLSNKPHYFYKVLQVEINSSDSDIKKAYRKASNYKQRVQLKSDGSSFSSR